MILIIAILYHNADTPLFPVFLSFVDMSLLLMALLTVISLVAAVFLAVMQSVFLWLEPESIQDIQNREGNRWLKKMIIKTDNVLGALSFGRDFTSFSAIILFTLCTLNDITVLKLIVHIVLVSIVIILITRALPQRLIYVRSLRWALALQAWIYAAYVLFSIPALALAWFANQIGYAAKKHFIRVNGLFDSGLYMNAVRRSDRAVTQDDDGRTAHLLQTHIAQLSRYTVAQIMQPIETIPCVNGALPIEEVIDSIINTSSARLILYDETPDNIIGIIHAGLLAKALCDVEGDRNGVEIISVASEPLYTKTGTTVIEQIQIFHRNQTQFALVTDASNRVVGAVSMDIIFANMMRALS